MVDPEVIRREALRLYRRYAVEFVEAFGLCPWAQRARLDGKVIVHPVLSRNPSDFAASLALIREESEPARHEIVLLVYPLLRLGPSEFEGYVRELREADLAQHPPRSAPFAMAAFHPDHQPRSVSRAEQLIPFWRRSPDPTVQLVRFSVLEEVRGKHPDGTAFVDPNSFDLGKIRALMRESVRDRIARVNRETYQREGLERLTEVLADIHADRARTYAELGLLEHAES